MRKRMTAIILSVVLAISATACGGGSQASSEASAEKAEAESAEKEEEKTEAQEEATGTEETAQTEQTEENEAAPEDDGVEDESWDDLASLGQVETENGIFFVTITLPANLVGEEVTQEELDEKVGESYLSATLNEDGSVTYKMTKAQHKAMLDGFASSMQESIQEIIDSDDYATTAVTYNEDMTQFDVTVSTEELGLYDSFSVLTYYMYGAIYGIFSGKTPEKVIVNFYNANGDLIETADSSQMEE